MLRWKILRIGTPIRSMIASSAAGQASTRAVQLASILYDKGLSDSLTVLDAERTLRDVEDQLAASETDATANVIRLYKALGGGWEAFE